MINNIKYQTLIGVSLGSSILGFVWAYFSEDPTIAQRAGALSVAISFFIVFSRESYFGQMSDAFQSLQEKRDLGCKQLDRNYLHETLADLKREIKNELKGQDNQNTALAWSSLFGTLMCGFGDLLVKFVLCKCS